MEFRVSSSSSFVESQLIHNCSYESRAWQPHHHHHHSPILMQIHIIKYGYCDCLASKINPDLINATKFRKTNISNPLAFAFEEFIIVTGEEEEAREIKYIRTSISLSDRVR